MWHNSKLNTIILHVALRHFSKCVPNSLSWWCTQNLHCISCHYVLESHFFHGTQAGLWEGWGEVVLRTRRREGDGCLALLDPHKLLREFFLFTLQQRTKKMEKSLCFLAGVLLLGGFLDTALMDDNATTESFLTLTSGTTATTAEPVTLQHKTERPTPTTAPSKPASPTVRANSNSREEESSEEEDSREDEKTKLGKE